MVAVLLHDDDDQLEFLPDGTLPCHVLEQVRFWGLHS